MVIRFQHKFLGMVITAFLLFFASHSVAQDIRVTARVDSNTILIGDWLNVYLEIDRPANVTPGSPQFPDSIQGFEIVTLGAPSSLPANDRIIDKATLTVTAFDSGSYVFPSIVIPYTMAGDTTRRSAATDPIPVTVHGIAIDTALGIKDIKPPLSLPLTFAEILPYIVAVILIAAIIWLIVYVLKKRKKGESIIPPSPPRPAHEIALESLTVLESEHLWQRGKIKEYHSKVTEIIRLYIEQRFHVMALEQTSDEILTSEPIKTLPEENRSNLKTMLARADLVKFAKFQPTPQENEQSLVSAVLFVHNTTDKPSAVMLEPVQEEVQA